MKTPKSAILHLAALLTLAAPGFFVTPVRAQIPIGDIVPVVSIRASVAGTREPFCDPAVCDAALPAPGVFVVTRRGGDLTRELFVSMSYTGTAAGGTDYPALPGFVTFRAGEASVELLVEAAYDRLSEGNETVVAQVEPDLTMGPIERYKVDPALALARIVIHDNESPAQPVVSIEASSPIAEESSFPFRRLALRGRFTISRTGSTEHGLPVFVLYGGTATLGVDYPFLPWLVTIPAGTNRIEIEVVPKTDDVPEPIETVEATLSECPPLTDPPMGIPCYLVNIDPAHASARVFIRDDGITTASLEITSPKDGTQFSAGTPIHIAATAIDLDGAITHVDFFDGDQKIGESTILFFQEPDPGTPIHHEFEWNGAGAGLHALTTRALNAAGNAVTSAPVRVLVGDGLPVVSIRATHPETGEPCPVCRFAPGVFVISRTGPTANPLIVFLVARGTATPGDDYLPLPPTVEIPAGQDAVELLVQPKDDTLVEGDETVIANLQLDPALGPLERYRIDPEHREATVTIHDDDLSVIPVVSIRASRPETPEPLCPPRTCLAPEPAPGVFVISRRGGDLTQALYVFLRNGGSALPRLDYAPLPDHVEIPAGQQSVELFVTALFDELAEGDESVVVALLPDPSLGPVERYRIDAAQAVARVIIQDRTPPTLPVVTLVATDPFAREGANPVNTATFRVRRVGATNSDLTVHLAVGGTAVNGSDYTAIPNHVTIPAGSRSARILVTPIDDQARERIETVTIELLNAPVPLPIPPVPPTYFVGSPGRAAAIIVDNDATRPPCLRLPDGLFNVCVPMGVDHCFRVESTRDLKVWTPHCTVPVNEGAAHYIDPDAPASPHKFYRLVPVACEPEE